MEPKNSTSIKKMANPLLFSYRLTMDFAFIWTTKKTEDKLEPMEESILAAGSMSFRQNLPHGPTNLTF